MADLLAFCVSPENALLTGQVLYADGGVEMSVAGRSLMSEPQTRGAGSRPFARTNGPKTVLELTVNFFGLHRSPSTA